ncbi:MAG: glycoside hydrolase family 57 protein [Salinivirgaceae bacterium]|jgi:alpha-amylase|nr:glycoside hydrolase family 57 protein [Salinivirgaceae bacterium]HQA76230.1 glycoside hydrolase family 57 protein [Salinivirgaceae bacterium]
MKKICLYFEVHQPYRPRTYRFFDIGHNHNYFDDYANKNQMRRLAEKCYLPANQIILDLLNKHKGKFKIAFSISGVAIDLMKQYTPEVLDSFQKLAKTKHVEFLAETYAHSLVALKNKEEFLAQVVQHSKTIEELFNYKPKTFRNTELIYSNDIGADVFELGYEGIVAEGAKHILGWRSPNFVYVNPVCPKQKVLLRNFKLSDDIAFRFSDRNWDQWPLTAEKYVTWLKNIDAKEEIVNIFMDYETFGEHQPHDSGIMDFLRYFPEHVIKSKELEFVTPAEAVKSLQPISPINIEYPTSWADEERDTTAWLGNELQKDAVNKLYEMQNFINSQTDPEIKKIYYYLQSSDHFYLMSTKWFSDGGHKRFNPFGSPYEAYINFRNILNDFMLFTGFTFDIRHELERLTKVNRRQEEIIRELRHLTGTTKAKPSRKTSQTKKTATTEESSAEDAKKENIAKAKAQPVSKKVTKTTTKTTTKTNKTNKTKPK